MPQFEYTQETQDLRDAQEGRVKWGWRERIAESFFVKSKDDSRYAFARFSVQSGGCDDDDMIGSAGINVLLNLSGIRNLEFDPAKAIKPKP